MTYQDLLKLSVDERKELVLSVLTLRQKVLNLDFKAEEIDKIESVLKEVTAKSEKAEATTDLSKGIDHWVKSQGGTIITPSGTANPKR